MSVEEHPVPSEDDLKALLEQLDEIETISPGRRLFGWGVTGVLLGLAVAAVALVFESYFSDGDGGGEARPKGDAEPAGRKAREGGRPPRATERAGATEKATPVRKAPAGKAAPAGKTGAAGRARAAKPKADFKAYVDRLPSPLHDLMVALDAMLVGLGSDVQRAVLKRYVAYKRGGTNFACVAARPTAGSILVYLRLEPPPSAERLPFMRDVRRVGHIGTGDLELRIADPGELGASRDYLARSYAAE